MNNYYSQNKKIVNSPFLVKGILNDTIIYDSIYSLKHFEPVFDLNGKIKTIGSGSYGQVYLGLNTITNEYYAIKHMDKKNIQNLLHSLTAVQKEIEIQSKIEHPNIVKLLYVKETDISYDLIMEYAKGGNLFHFIRKTKGLSEDLSFSLFIQVVNAINFLHENDLIHRDIKPENILMFENNIVKLCDFGWCVKLNGQQRGTFCGTTEYMSPELVNRSGYGKEIDVWSLGILLYEMIHGYSPFRPNKPEFDEKDVMENIINHNIVFEKNVSYECQKLIYGLLEPNIRNRYKVEDIYNSEFVKKYEQIKFGYQNNNIKMANQTPIQAQNQINNIIYSPQIEMNNNINILMTMDTNNYIYNIQIPEKKDIYSNYQKNNARVRNQSFPKVNKGIYSNYINSSNNNSSLYNNNFINNNYYHSNSIESRNSIIKNNQGNLENISEIQNKTNKVKLLTNKTWDNFYPINIGKNREQELIEFIDIYSNNNDILHKDSKRDNKEFINFNNSLFYLYGQNENIYNNMNTINNNLYNNNLQVNNNSQYIQMSGSKDGNSTEFLNETNQKRMENISYDNNFSNLSNIEKKNYYNSSINNFQNSNHFQSIQSSLTKKVPLIQNNNSYNYDFTNSFNHNFSISSVPITYNNVNPNRMNDNLNENDNSKDINIVSKSSIFQSINKRLTKISEFALEDNQILNNNNTNGNEDIKIEINPYNNDWSNQDNKRSLSKSDIFYKDKLKKRFKKEKEPNDNFVIKKKSPRDGGKIRVKGINISINNNENNNIKNISNILNKKNEEIINIHRNQFQKKLSVNNIVFNYEKKPKKKTNKNNKINELKKANIPFCRNVNFDQPKEMIFKSKISYKNSHLIKSKSFCDQDLLQKMKKNKNKNNKKNINKNKYNLTNDKNNNINLKTNKYFYRQKIDYSQNINKDRNEKNKEILQNEKNQKQVNEQFDNSISEVSCSLLNVLYSKREKIDNKRNKKNNNKYNKNEASISLINKQSFQESLISKREKKPKNNNKKLVNKKEMQIPNSPEVKIKLQKNNQIIINKVGHTPNSKHFIKFTNNPAQNNIIKFEQSNIENNKSDNNIMKYLKICKTSEGKQNYLNNGVDFSNIDNNKVIIYSTKRENKKVLKPANSFSNINYGNYSNQRQNKKIKSNGISSDYKNKRKINTQKKAITILEFDSNIINNNSERIDTNDERNATPKKKSIFNKVKPNKLLEDFKKELSSKKDNILKLNGNNKI